MKIVLPKFTIVRMFFVVIIIPTAMVFVTIATMHHDPREYKVTEEVYLEIEMDGKPLGKMVFALFGEDVPLTVNNFVTFATRGFNDYSYKGSAFHRVIKQFMIQGKDTNGCQFFHHLHRDALAERSPCCVRQIVEGETILHEIEHVATDWNDRPLKDVIISNSGRRAKLDNFIIEDDGSMDDEETAKKKREKYMEEEKRLLEEEEKKKIEEDGKKEEGDEGEKEKKRANIEVRKRVGKAGGNGGKE
ncbi:Peptidyl-prolyl cis-trans isomerase B-like 4, partial [Homarus americanus]